MTKIALLMTGSELLAGDIQDSNSTWLAQTLKDADFHIQQKITVGDDLDAIIQALNFLSQHNDLILMNGGLGPTNDDLTAEALALFSGQPLQRHKQAEQHLMHWCEKRNYPLSDRQLKQCELPEQAQIFSASPGSACAFYIKTEGCTIIATPGVPSELKTIITEQGISFLQKQFGYKTKSHWQRFQCFGLGESNIQQLLDEKCPSLKDYYDIGYRAQSTQVELKLRALKYECEAALSAKQQCLSLLDDVIFAEGASTHAEALVNALQTQNLSLGLAESCTGGLIASQITAQAGVSNVFMGGIVCYSNSIKHAHLAVPSSILETQGAVSEACAKAMLDGTLAAFNTDLAIAVTGIAGPSGASKDKPLGTVYISFGSNELQHCIKFCIPLARVHFQQVAAALACDLLRRFVLNKPLLGPAIKRYQVDNKH